MSSIRLPDVIRKTVGKTIIKYDLIQADDHILVGLSGGKDSWALVYTLLYFQRVSPVQFRLTVVCIDPNFPGFETSLLENWFDQNLADVKFIIQKTNIAETIQRSCESGKNPCAFCARLRRGVMYKMAAQLGCNKIALGHHANDAIETMLLAGFFEGNLVSLPPRLNVSDDRFQLIRPLIRTWEIDLAGLAKQIGVPIIACKGHEGQGSDMRQAIKKLIADWDKKHPLASRNLLAALQQIKPAHFLDIQWL